MIGFQHCVRVVRPPKPLSAMRIMSRPCSAVKRRSLPAENALSPVPVRMPTHTSGSRSKSFQIASSSKLAGGCSAFMRSGRLTVTTAMRPFFS